MPTKLTDEQRVRAAVPQISLTYDPTTGNICRYWFNGEYTQCEVYGNGAGSVAAWKSALKHPTIAAYDALRLSAVQASEHMADTPELTEEGVTQAQMRLEAQVACRELHTGEGYIPERTRIWRPFLACRIKLREAHATIAALRAQLEEANDKA